MAYTARFNFIGEPLISKKSDDSFIRRFKGGKNGNTDMIVARFGVKESGTNSMWVESFGVKYDTIVTYDGNDKIEIPWEDRFNPDVLADIPSYRLYIAEFDDGEKRFLSKYDFVEYLEEKLPAYDGKIYCSGRYSRSMWKGQLYDKFEVDTVRATTAERNSLHLKLDLYYNKDCVDVSEFEDKKRITIDGYIRQYVGKDEGEMYFPQTVVLDVSKFDDTPQHQKYAKMLIQDVNIKSKNVVHLPWDCKVIRGTETVEFDPELLTDRQKMQIECGIAKIEDFTKPIGENIYEFRLFKQMLNGDFADGPVDTGITLDELKEDVFMGTEEPMTMKDVEEKAAEEEEISDTTLEDLLG